jgi:flavorubredoxin
MYGNTEAGVMAVARGIEGAGVPCTMHRVPDENVSYVLAAAYGSSGIVVAMPTYEYAMFPPMAYVLDMFRRKHVFGKKALRIGSWGWSGGAKREYDEALARLKWDGPDPVEWAGFPSAADLATLEARGAELARLV